MKLLFFLLRANKWMVLLAVAVSIVSGITNAGLVALIHRVWAWGAYTDPRWITAFVVVLIVQITSGLGAQLMVLRLSLRVISDLRMDLSAKILASPLRHLEKLGSARLMAVLTDDVAMISRILPNVPRMVIDLTTLCAGAIYMAWLSPVALLVILAFTTIGVLLYRVLMRRALRHMRHGRHVYDSLFDSLQAIYNGAKQLKLNQLRRRDFLARDLHEAVEGFRVANLAGRTLLISAENATRLLFFVILGLLIFVVPRMGIGVRSEILTGYVLMSLFLYRPLGSLMAMAPDLSRAAVSLAKVEELGLTLSARPDLSPPVAEALGWKRIELRGVTYSYRRDEDDRVFTVGPIDLTLEPGELVFVIGGNGSGKTTLAKLLCGLYPPDEGELLLDGEPVTSAEVERYRQLFSVVFSDFHLFSNVIAAGGADPDARAAEHLEDLELAHKVKVEGGVFSTTALSQGQRKRLALLAAYLEDRPFYLFDEWAADQDPQFKEVFYNRVLPELKRNGKTVLVITHDDRFLGIADRCVKLEEGMVRSETRDSTGAAS